MKNTIKRIPLARQVYRYFKEKEYEQKFATNAYGCFWGVFETFEQARQASPQTKSVGYNNADLAKEYQKMLEEHNWENTGRIIGINDYPILCWFKSIFEEGATTVFDFGGNMGVHFYSYSKYLEYPQDLKWTVCELPEIIKIAQRLAEKRCAKGLEFTSDFNEANGKDVFIASGSIQYVENLSFSLSSIDQKPKFLLINRLPLYDGDQFVTLQNGGQVFYPQYVFNQAEFIASITSIDYELIDLWQGVDTCHIPCHPEKSVPSYSGLYFRLKS